MPNTRNRNQNKNHGNCPIILAVLTPIYSACKKAFHCVLGNEKEDRHEDGPTKWARKLTQWTAIVALVGIATVAVLIRTDETARLRDRAFVYFNDPGVRKWPPPPSEPDRWAISIKIFNAGNVPARNVTIRHACPTPVEPEKIDAPYQSADWKKTPLPNVIGPHQDFSAQGCEFTTKEIEEAKLGKRIIFIAMETIYFDGFDFKTPRVTQMTRQLNIDTRVGYSLSFVDPHNCSDDDCPK